MIRQTLRDNKWTRWFVLFLVSFLMATGYFFADILSPLEDLLIKTRLWDGEQFGFFAGQYSFLNIIGFLVIGGIILDKSGIRFTGNTFIILMILGSIINAYGVSDYFNNDGFGYDFFNSFWTDMQPSVKLASVGYALFGLG
ncbi:MAG: MFS transporter, partial [Bacteroidia bacterium]|nr:MFS transporter [Bacteroidia bacterium]